MRARRKHKPHEPLYPEHQICRLRMFDLGTALGHAQCAILEYAQRDKYSGRPLTNDSHPISLAGTLGGSSSGKSRREIMTIEQYAPLP